jgi:monofunctional biosynthetic peptidoglycan transglycosylase
MISASGEVDDGGVPRPVHVTIAGDAIAATLDHVPVAAAAPWLPAALAVGAARLTGTVDASRFAGGVSISARGELAGAELRSSAIADHPVPLDVSGELTAHRRGAALEVDARFVAGKATLTATAHLDRGVTGWDHGLVRVRIPPTPCLDVLDAIPRPLRGATAGLTVDGTASARFDLKLAGTAEPGQAVRLATQIDVAGCRVLAEAPGGDPARLLAKREHVFFDGSRATIGPGTDRWVRLDDLHGYVPGAFVAAEDTRFWDHRGFDVEQIARSLEVDLRENRLARGGSTISQQLVKNVFLGAERTFARKLQEAILTWRLEATTAKKTILEQYLNVIELGPGVFGLDAAARHWFDRTASRLTTRQAAFLAALTPEPKSMTARIQAARGLDRRSKERVDVVLRAMKRAGVIDAARLEAARASDLDFRRGALRAPDVPSR